jgi:hypothetical protein
MYIRERLLNLRHPVFDGPVHAERNLARDRVDKIRLRSCTGQDATAFHNLQMKPTPGGGTTDSLLRPSPAHSPLPIRGFVRPPAPLVFLHMVLESLLPLGDELRQLRLLLRSKNLIRL